LETSHSDTRKRRARCFFLQQQFSLVRQQLIRWGKFTVHI
jgi:hypothetical protein